jgi:hypothetical protein
MTDDEVIEFQRLKTARDSLLLKVANLRGQLETIAIEEREACAKACEEVGLWPSLGPKHCAEAIRARGQA